MAFEFWRYASPGWGLRQDIERRRRRLNVLLPGEPGVEEIEPETAPPVEPSLLRAIRIAQGAKARGGVSPFFPTQAYQGKPEPFRPGPFPMAQVPGAVGRAAKEFAIASVMRPPEEEAEFRELLVKPDKTWQEQTRLAMLSLSQTGTPEQVALSYWPGGFVGKLGGKIPKGVKAGKRPKAAVPEALVVGDRIRLNPRTSTMGGKYKSHPRQDVNIEAVEPAENGGQVLRFRYKDVKGREKLGYANTLIDKYDVKFSAVAADAMRQREITAAKAAAVPKAAEAVAPAEAVPPVAPRVVPAEAVAPEVITPKAFSIDDVIAWKRKNVAEASGVMERSFRNQELKDLLAGKKAGRQTVSEEYFRNPRTKELEIPVELQPKPQISKPAFPKAEAVAPAEALAPEVTKETTALIQQLREAFVGTDRLDEAIAILPDGMALTGREFKGVGAFQHLAEGLPPVEQWLDAGVVRTGLEANGTFFVEIRGGLSSEQFSTLSKLMRDAPNVIVDFGYFQNEIVKSLQGTPNIVRRQLRELIAIPKAEALPPEVARVMPSELGPAVEVAPKAGALPPARPPIELPPPVEAAPAKAKIPPSVPSAPVITPGGKLWLPEPPRTTPAYMAATRKAMGGVFRGKKGAFDTIEEAHQMVLKARDMGEQTVPYVQSYIAQIGDVVKSFGVDKQGMATLVGNPGGRSLAINDVLSNFTHYTLTPEQLELAKRSGLVYQEALKLARSYGVKISELGGPDEFWQYIARRVKSKLNPLTGEYEMPPSVIGGFKMGAKISAQKERVFEEMAQGVDLGFLYENPAQVMTQHIRGIYRLIGNKQAQNLIKPLTRQITAKAPLKFGERAIAEPALKSRAAAVELANAIDKIFLAQQAPRALRGAADISGAMVGQVAALDISAPFIQGLPVIGHDLKMGLRGKPSGVWLKSYGNMWKAVWNPESINNFRMRNAELYKRAIEAGILTGQSEFVSGVGTVQKGLGKIPKVGPPLKEVYRQVYGRMGQAYSDFLEIARLKLFEQLEPVWAREGHNTFELGAVINRMTGTVSSAARGVGPMQRTAERTAAFAPNYLRASLLLLRDLISRGASAREVQTSLAALLGIGAAVYYAEEKLRGQEPLMKPWPRRLGGNGAAAFTFGIGDTRVGLGSWMYGMIKTLTEVGAMAVDEPGVLVVWNERHPIVKFAKSKRGPMVGLIQELATGRDFFGQKLEGPTDYLLRLVETVVPISAQPMISQKPKGELVQVGAELMGLRAHPYSLKSRWADEGAFKAYEDIPAQSRSAFRKGHPDIDAKLFITGQVDSILSEQASRQVIQLILENKIDPETISGVQRNKEEREKWAEAKLRDPSKITPTDRLVRYLESPAFKAQQKLKQAPAPSQPEMPQELQDFIKQNTALEEVLKRAWQAYQEGNFKVAEGLWDSYDLSAYQQKKKELRERLREGAGVAIR